jgi:hypothetical protein
MTLVSGATGKRLLLQVDGDAEISFAEIVQEDGRTQTVDFNDATVGAGVYTLVDFPDARRIDHVRLVARSKSPETRFILRLAA